MEVDKEDEVKKMTNGVNIDTKGTEDIQMESSMEEEKELPTEIGKNEKEHMNKVS